MFRKRSLFGTKTRKGRGLMASRGLLGQLVKYIGGAVGQSIAQRSTRPLSRQETRPIIVRDECPDFFQDEPIGRPLQSMPNRAGNVPYAPTPAAQPQDWQEAKRRSFELAGQIPGLVIGQLSDGTKTLHYAGQVRQFASWLALWTALSQRR